MYETDIERLVAQAQRIQRVGNELLDKTETLEESGVDVSTNVKVSEKQQELQQQLKQAISDFNDAHSRSNMVGRSPEYDYGRGSFSFTEDYKNSTVTIEYTGDVELHPSDANIVVTLAGSEITNVFNSPTQTGDTFNIDTSGVSDGDELRVEWKAKTIGKSNLPEVASPAVDSSALPHSQLIDESTQFDAVFTVGSSQNVKL